MTPSPLEQPTARFGRLCLIWILPCLFVVGCGVRHIRPHTPRERNFRPGDYQQAPQPVSEGSLWHDSSVSLLADFRATRVGDLVTIRIDESPRAEGDARVVGPYLFRSLNYGTHGR